jgi:hypothetical protein
MRLQCAAIQKTIIQTGILCSIHILRPSCCQLNAQSVWSSPVPETRLTQRVSIITAFLVYFPYFEKNKSRLIRSPSCLCTPLSFLVSGLANTFLQQRIQNRILLSTLFFMSPFFPPYHSAATALLLLAYYFSCATQRPGLKSTAFPTSSQYTAELWNW